MAFFSSSRATIADNMCAPALGAVLEVHTSGEAECAGKVGEHSFLARAEEEGN